MKYLQATDIRKLFLEYFESQGHKLVASSSLIPAEDPSLLFTNAGMVQFKDTFLGIEQRPYTQAASSQRCVRAGGKHNDLENVGYTRRHHTFFEMLGNFSFGDYFKREAIQYAWKFLTEVLGIPAQRLWVSVFQDDVESEEIWLNEIKIDPRRLSRCGEKDNFWQMGDTGPCGPCTEIFYDHGQELAGGPPGSPDEDGDRYVEIWNIVFMQYERNAQGELNPLPRPCVDTGMGLERIAAVLQGVHDNYDIDLFQYLLKALEKITGVQDPHSKSMRVIVDHIRSVAFLIADGVMPSNEGRGYVLRRIMRRAIRHGHMLGVKDLFFHRMVAPLVEVMGNSYPGLRKAQSQIERVIKQEEEQFSRTLARGLKILDQELADLTQPTLSGQVVFQLYDTFGFPPDLTADIARERGLQIDKIGFEQAMQKQKEQSYQSQQFSVDQTKKIQVNVKTQFVGYEELSCDATVLGLASEDMEVGVLSEGQTGVVILDRTPFYAESGGQVGDAGELAFSFGIFTVRDTQKQGDVYLHIGTVTKGTLAVNDQVTAVIDAENRQAIRCNHSATHLLHEALRRLLGEQVRQKGSLVEAKRLRFDFSHARALTSEEIQQVERLVNAEVRKNSFSETTITSPEQAVESGAIAFFGERYGAEVRVLKMGDFSTEICGGTHVGRTGDIGLFKIISETACASGIRRIEAVTGQPALEFVEQKEQQLQYIAQLLKTQPNQINKRLEQLLEKNRDAERELMRVKQQQASQQSADLSTQAVNINGINVLAIEIKNVDMDALRNALDQLKQKLVSAAIVLCTVNDGKIQLVSTVSENCLAYFTATDLVNQVAHKLGGKGGGRPTMAQGGGTDIQALPAALSAVPVWVKSKLQ